MPIRLNWSQGGQALASLLMLTSFLQAQTEPVAPAVPAVPTALPKTDAYPEIPNLAPPAALPLNPQLESFLRLRTRRTTAYGEAPQPGQSLVDDSTKGAGAADEKKHPLFSLGECIQIALSHQPALKAVQASQQATTLGYSSLQNIGPVARLLRRDLPYRQQQACRGIAAAAADAQKVHNEIIYDVTRLYYTVVYARQQQQVADDVVAQLTELVDIGKKLLASPMPGEMNAMKLATMEMGLDKAKRMQSMARIGQQQAMAALYEALGVTPETMPFQVKDKELPIMTQKMELTQEMVVQFALDRRPELALAAAGVDAFRLEVLAQQKSPFRRPVNTFAVGSDLHAHPVPQSIRDKEYRPGGIEPEMPAQLVGSPAERAARAAWYAQRAENVYEKARNLVKLDAENAYLRFLETAEWVELNKHKYEQGNRLAELSRQGQENIRDKSQLVLNEVMAAEARADYVESVYQHILSLAALERVTAGAIQPAFPGR